MFSYICWACCKVRSSDLFALIFFLNRLTYSVFQDTLKEQQINLIDWLNSAIKEQYLNHGLSTSVMLIFGAMVKKKTKTIYAF